MIRCTKCDTINPADAIFCSNCASFLEWTGVKADPVAAPAATADAGPVAEADAAPVAEVDAGLTAEADAGPVAEASAAAATEGGAAPAAEADAGPAAESPATAEPPAHPVPLAAEPASTVEEATATVPVVVETVAAEGVSVAASASPPAAEKWPGPARADRPVAVPPSGTAAPPEAPPAAATRPPDQAKASEPIAAREPIAPPAPPAPPVQPPPVRPVARAAEPPPRRPVHAEPVHAEPDEDQPASRKPTLAAPPRPRARPDEAAAEPAIAASPGDVICAVCATPNDPARRFCRRCGNRLAAAAPVAAARVPWYRRILRRSPRPEVHAGERPARLGESAQPRPGVIGQLVPIVLVGVLAFALTSVLVIPGVRNSIAGFATDLRLRFLPEIVDVHPVAVRGAGVGRNTAMLAIDDNTATFWLADPKAGAPTVTAEFAAPINLGGIVVHSGSTTDSDFIRHRRPKTIELSFPGTDRPPVDLVLADTADPQALAVDVRDVRTTAIRIVDWFESAAGGDALLAVREIELKERR